MSSDSLDCVEFFPNAEEPRSSVDPEQFTRGLSPTSFEHAMPSSEQWVYILELGRRISSINQLTSDQRASLSNNVIFSIHSYMADHPTVMGSGLTHMGGRRQPSEERSSSSDQGMPDRETTPEVRNAPASTSRPTEPARGGRSKAHARRDRSRGRRACGRTAIQFRVEKKLPGRFHSLRWINIHLG